MNLEEQKTHKRQPPQPHTVTKHCITVSLWSAGNPFYFSNIWENGKTEKTEKVDHLSGWLPLCLAAKTWTFPCYFCHCWKRWQGSENYPQMRQIHLWEVRPTRVTNCLRFYSVCVCVRPLGRQSFPNFLRSWTAHGSKNQSTQSLVSAPTSRATAKISKQVFCLDTFSQSKVDLVFLSNFIRNKSSFSY